MFTLCPGFGSLQTAVLHQLEGEGHVMDLEWRISKVTKTRHVSSLQNCSLCSMKKKQQQQQLYKQILISYCESVRLEHIHTPTTLMSPYGRGVQTFPLAAGDFFYAHDFLYDDSTLNFTS